MNTFSKNELRENYKQQRQQLSEEKVTELSKQIHDWLFSRLMMHRYEHIHTYLPIKKQREVDTWPIINTLRRDFAPDLYIAKSYPNGTLTHHRFPPATPLTENAWGVLEPADTSEPVPPQTFNLVIIPLLAYDKRGFRVGYGGGYYDRFLADCSPECLKVGLSFFEPVDEIADIDGNDVSMDYCVTPNKIWTFLR